MEVKKYILYGVHVNLTYIYYIFERQITVLYLEYKDNSKRNFAQVEPLYYVLCVPRSTVCTTSWTHSITQREDPLSLDKLLFVELFQQILVSSVLHVYSVILT